MKIIKSVGIYESMKLLKSMGIFRGRKKTSILLVTMVEDLS